MMGWIESMNAFRNGGCAIYSHSIARSLNQEDIASKFSELPVAQKIGQVDSATSPDSGGGIQIKKRSGKFPRIDGEGGASFLLHRGRLQSSDEQGMHKVRWLA